MDNVIRSYTVKNNDYKKLVFFKYEVKNFIGKFCLPGFIYKKSSLKSKPLLFYKLQLKGF